MIAATMDIAIITMGGATAILWLGDWVRT